MPVDVYLRSIELSHFRNFSGGTFEFCPGLNLFFGPNAAGKTNVLEAIHLLSNLRSFRTRSWRELLQWEASESYIRGVIHPGNLPKYTGYGGKNLAVGITAHARIPLINSKPCKTSKDYLQILPSATFVPDDLSLVKGTPAYRRYFLDRGTFLCYPLYWALLSDYTRGVQQKNVLLRNWQRQRNHQRKTPAGNVAADASYEVWNLQLQTLGTKLILQRLVFIQQLQRLVNEVYSRWLGNTETIKLLYRSSIGLTGKGVQEQTGVDTSGEEHHYHKTFEKYGEAIQRSSEREIRLGTTVIGPHRDDLEIRLDGRPLRAYGSQGQQRTAVLALKLAEIQLYFEQYAEYPILLLDDVTSELDMQRNTKLFEYFHQGIQVFMTATSRLDFPSFHSIPCQYFDLSRQ